LPLKQLSELHLGHLWAQNVGLHKKMLKHVLFMFLVWSSRTVITSSFRLATFRLLLARALRTSSPCSQTSRHLQQSCERIKQPTSSNQLLIIFMILWMSLTNLKGNRKSTGDRCSSLRVVRFWKEVSKADDSLLWLENNR
jgi:hypothetical protein